MYFSDNGTTPFTLDVVLTEYKQIIKQKQTGKNKHVNKRNFIVAVRPVKRVGAVAR